MEDVQVGEASAETQIVRKNVRLNMIYSCNSIKIFYFLLKSKYTVQVFLLLFQAEDALNYVKNRKIFWAQQQTPEKIKKHIDKSETHRAKLIAIGTFIKESIPKAKKPQKPQK